MRILLLFLCLVLPAAAEVIVPVPPEFILDKQLPGEDPFAVDKPCFSPDGKLVAGLMHSSRKVTVWDIAAGKVVAEIPDSVHGLDAVDGLDFSNDGKLLLMLRNFQPMKFVDWKSGKVTREIPLDADPKKIYSYAYSPKQDLLAVGTSKGIALWDVVGGKKLKDYVPGQTISGLDIAYVTTRDKKTVRLMAYSRALFPPEAKFQKVAGIIDLDSGKTTPLLDDVPAAKKIDDKMLFTQVQFEWGASHALITYQVLPPTVKAGAFLVDTWTGKHVANHELGQKTLAFLMKYLAKPYYGFYISTADQSVSPYKRANEFLVVTKEGLKVIDRTDETVHPMMQVRFDKGNGQAALVLKKTQEDTAKIFIYKVRPKKK
ncbi:MAG: WD40 repeat domain-containing protein [Armatimonadetes bacterium]|nr:WD40 repeat domain-containing protein [Armatimonadota bacterium]